jgi:hypothetical protein
MITTWGETKENGLNHNYSRGENIIMLTLLLTTWRLHQQVTINYTDSIEQIIAIQS